tara:strand:- start:40 stop:558 length:519 start_codon:yes stop_codon:yes gene_type:complete
MNWFNIIKVLGTKSGFSQLDFDNIVIEDETNCLKRLRELNAKLHKYTVDGQEKEIKNNFSNMTRYLLYTASEAVGEMQVNKEIPNIPEEIACALIEFIQGIKDYKYKKEIGSQQGEYHFSFTEHDYSEGRVLSEGNSYMLLYVGVGKMMYRIFFVNTLEAKDKFKEWISSVV